MKEAVETKLVQVMSQTAAEIRLEALDFFERIEIQLQITKRSITVNSSVRMFVFILFVCFCGRGQTVPYIVLFYHYTYLSRSVLEMLEMSIKTDLSSLVIFSLR